MRDGVAIVVTGDKAIDRLLRQLPVRNQKNAVRRAVRSGAAIIRDEARKRVPVRTGKLKKSIGVKSSRRKSMRNEIMYQAAPNLARNHNAPHAGLVEYGSPGDRIVKRAVLRDVQTGEPRVIESLNVGQMPAQPYMRPAFDANRNRVNKHVEEKIKTGMIEEVNKLRGRD